MHCRSVETSSGLEVPAIFPSNAAAVRLPLPSAGSAWVSSPASSVLWAAPTSRLPSCLAWFPLARQYRPSCSCSLSSPRAPRLRAWTWSPGVHPGLRPESTRSPGFPGSPCTRAPLSDPGEVIAPDHQRDDVAFHLGNGVGPHIVFPFEAPSRSPRAPCVRFAARGRPRATQHSVPAGWSALAGQAVHLLGSNRRFLFS